jgi:hypothetical protein
MILHHRHSTVRDDDLLHRHHSPFRTHDRSSPRCAMFWLELVTVCGEPAGGRIAAYELVIRLG